ncbi:MAG: hypothetical protein ACFFBR_09530 [Promethearchaeota archaeon]
MSSISHYYRPPRRVPSRDSEEEPSTQRSRTRDIIILFIGLVIVCLVLFGLSIVLRNLGFHSMALGLSLFATILVWVTVGVGVAVAITFYVMQSFLKREFKKRFDRMDRERNIQYRRMMGLDESEEKDQ